jgi:hypothetical protein
MVTFEPQPKAMQPISKLYADRIALVRRKPLDPNARAKVGYFSPGPSAIRGHQNPSIGSTPVASSLVFDLRRRKSRVHRAGDWRRYGEKDG